MRVLLILSVAAAAWANPFSSAVTGMLSNGLRVILLPDPSLPVVSSTVLVGAGSEREDESTSGATHLLEHLLFNGTATMTQEQLYETMDLHGLYLNAATRERGTIIIGLSAPDELAALLGVQADMLFSSTIPADKFDKEKQIVLEEIAKDRSQPEDFLWLQRARALYGPSPCRFPILGSPSTIEAMPRERVVTYYHRHYVPNNMTLLLIGRFPWPGAWEMLRQTFGAPSAAMVDASPPCPFSPDRAATDTVWAPLPSAAISLTLAGPGPGDAEFPSFFLASKWVPEALTRMGNPAVSSWDAGLHIGRHESRLTCTAGVVAADSCDAVAAGFDGWLRNALTAGDGDIRRAAQAWRAEATGWLERPHMLAVMAYDLLTSLGWEGVAHLWDRLGQLDAITWRREVAPYLMAAPVATLYELPRGDAVSYQGLDPVPGAEAEGSEAMTRPRPVFEERMPRLEISEFGTETIYQDASDTLPSGLVIWVRSEPGLDLAGMHVLFRRRGALEPPGKEGVAELLHRIIGAGPAGMREGAFATRLADLGATLQVTDNPWLPFDDYYYSSRWGYLRVTSPPESLAAVTSELVAAICSPRADSVTIDRERSAIMAAVAREGRSAGKAAGRLLWEYLAEGDPRSRSPLGTPGSVARLGPTDVVDFALRYRAGDNLIVTVCTPLPARETLAHMRDAWVALPTESAFSAATPVAFSPGPRILEDSLGVGQGQLVMALTMPVAAQERPAAQLLAAILDRRMGLVLREQLGLAYSLGAQVSLEGRAGLIVASMGTRPERLPEGESRLRELVTQLVSDSFDDSVETIAAAMGMEQRGRLRNLTRVGRAFSMGMDLMNGEPPSAPGALAACRSVTADQLRAVAGRLNLNEAITVVVR